MIKRNNIKTIIEDGTREQGTLDAREIEWHGSELLEVEIGLGNNSTEFVYLMSITAGNRSESLIAARCGDGGIELVQMMLKDKNLGAEMAKRWPSYYGMVQAGIKDVYSDTALIGMNNELLIVTKFDMDRLSQRDGFEYLVEKALFLLKGYMQMVNEMSENELKLNGVKLRGMIDSAVDGYKSAKMANTIMNVLRFFI